MVESRSTMFAPRRRARAPTARSPWVRIVVLLASMVPPLPSSIDMYSAWPFLPCVVMALSVRTTLPARLSMPMSPDSSVSRLAVSWLPSAGIQMPVLYAPTDLRMTLSRVADVFSALMLMPMPVSVRSDASRMVALALPFEPR